MGLSAYFRVLFLRHGVLHIPLELIELLVLQVQLALPRKNFILNGVIALCWLELFLLQQLQHLFSRGLQFFAQPDILLFQIMHDLAIFFLCADVAVLQFA